MSNEVVKKETKAVATTTTNSALTLQKQLVGELEKANREIANDFTDYGKQCVVNCIAGIISFCKTNKISFNSLDPVLLRLQLQNVGFTELNYATIPSELYFDVRKITNSKGEVSNALTIKPQGAGNEKLVRKWGVGIKPEIGLHNPILIREGDEFVMPTYNGIEITAPIYRPKFENANNKIVGVCYCIEKVDGTKEYLIATRESVKANLIAQIRQNSLYAFMKTYKGKNGKEYETPDKEKRDEFYKWLDEYTASMKVDDMLADEKLVAYINPTYTSGGSKEAMILRKMKNNALKNYPKEYDNSAVANAVQDMFEEQDKSVLERKGGQNVINNVEYEINEDTTEERIDDFSVDDEEDEKVVDTVVDTPKEETVEQETTDDDLPY